eukprot:Phypoly_transcript_06657.p1 GENE.Phypoly_transcript_06657~~Phypoly_transcript_06657.p1  ORF type:complete len:498 (+),score=105.92 Phypoly_transcript_06657:259-1752(+)
MSLTLSLYRDILKKARLFDKQPVLKVRLIPPALTSVFEAKAEERQHPPRDPYYYYTPHSFGGGSFYQTFKDLFQEAVRKQSTTGLTNAFSVIRDLNDTIALASGNESAKKTQPLTVPSEDKKAPTSGVFLVLSDSKKKPKIDDLRTEAVKLMDELEKLLKNKKGLEKLFQQPNKEITITLEPVEEHQEEKEKEDESEEEKEKEKEKEAGKEEEKASATETEGDTETVTGNFAENSAPKKEGVEQSHLWVRPSDKIAVGTILVSHPAHDRHDNRRSLDCFYRSTVLITGITQKLTYGLMLNKPLFPEEAKEKYQVFTSHHKDYKKLGVATMPATLEKANWFFGGPGDIHPAQPFNLSAFPTFSALHSSPQVPDAKLLLEGLYCGGSMMKLMNLIESGEVDLSKVRLFVGGATWSQGQLRDEINKGWWIQGEASPDFIFGNYKNSYERHWEDALTLMGGEYLNFVEAAKIMGHPKNFEYSKSRVPYCTLQMLNVNIDAK